MSIEIKDGFEEFDGFWIEGGTALSLVFMPVLDGIVSVHLDIEGVSELIEVDWTVDELRGLIANLERVAAFAEESWVGEAQAEDEEGE